jgi:hypothetical protein
VGPAANRGRREIGGGAGIGRRRLAAQRVGGAGLATPTDVVRHLGAVQAQDYLGALWAVGLRARNALEASVEAAIAAGSIVRTWPMRGTLHFVAAADIRWMLSLLAPRVLSASKGRYRQLELDDAVFAKCRRIFGKALPGRQLTRPALYRLLAESKISTAGTRGLHILGHLSQQGLICFGPRDGKQQTFALLDEWVPGATPFERDAALAELAERYFTGHGPATVHDFSWWSGLTLREARLGIALAASRLEREDAIGRTLWSGGRSTSTAASVGAELLPAFDEYTVAYRDRTDVIDPRFIGRVQPGGGMLAPTLVIDGRVVGTWRRTLAKGSVAVTVSPFGGLTRASRELLEGAVARYARFLGMASTLSVAKA